MGGDRRCPAKPKRTARPDYPLTSGCLGAACGTPTAAAWRWVVTPSSETANPHQPLPTGLLGGIHRRRPAPSVSHAAARRSGSPPRPDIWKKMRRSLPCQVGPAAGAGRDCPEGRRKVGRRPSSIGRGAGQGRDLRSWRPGAAWRPCRPTRSAGWSAARRGRRAVGRPEATHRPPRPSWRPRCLITRQDDVPPKPRRSIRRHHRAAARCAPSSPPRPAPVPS